ncbi:MAG: helicase-related protein [Gemmatimonadaceae bacterium]
MRREIALAFLGAAPAPLRVGNITLHPHQRSAVARIRRQLVNHGGALLCDEVGLGKTYVALAIAETHDHVTVIAPAALSGMWRQALDATRIHAEFISIETLGRAGPVPRRRSLIIVDEAHHFRNPSTRRYSALAQVCAVTPVLLLTATPLHNSRDDLSAIVALFIGTRAYAMSAAELAPLVVRRSELENLGQQIPIVCHAAPKIVLTSEMVLDAILELPAPVPPSDGSIATSLVIHGLVRQWASSHAALEGALRRRIARSHGLLASLDAGRYPTAAELSAWVYAGDCVQLAFAELLLPATTPLATIATSLRTHVNALTSLLSLVQTHNDDALTEFVRTVRVKHPGETIVAFSCYAETAEVLYKSLRNDGHAALLTARGALIASGPVPRDEILAQFAPQGAPAQRTEPHKQVKLLISTDLLSEGVNLQEASVIIHLDLPWTAARMQQRVGRLARIGSRHPRVTCYTVNPPARAEAFLHELEIIARKSDASARLFGTTAVATQQGEARPGAIASEEATRRMLEQWRYDGDEPSTTAESSIVAHGGSGPGVAFVSTQRPGAVGVWLIDGSPKLLACNESGSITEESATVSDAARVADSSVDVHTETELDRATGILQAALDWYHRRRARAAIGMEGDGIAADPPKFGNRARDVRKSISHVADATIARATFAHRGESAALATRLRRAATLPLPLAVEWSLESISDCADDADVNTILDLVDRARPTADRVLENGICCIALIVFVPPTTGTQ